jgi:hypothetical protein
VAKKPLPLEPHINKGINDALHEQIIEKAAFTRLFKNIQMQGTQNPEE